MFTVHTLATVAAVAAEATDKQPAWYTIVSGVFAIPVAILTVYAGILASRKTRLETMKLQRELLSAPTTTPPAPENTPSDGRRDFTVGEMATARTSRAIVASVEGFVIRFILFYLVYSFVGILQRAVNPILAYSVFFIRDAPIAIQYALGLSQSYVNLAVDIVIFISFGLPLLRDILGTLGLTPRELFSRETRHELSFRQMRQTERT